jgi:hypothetical protein
MHRGRWLTLPIPIFLFWLLASPLLLFAFVFGGRPFISRGLQLRALLPLLFHLGGLEIDVSSHEVERVRIRFI